MTTLSQPAKSLRSEPVSPTADLSQVVHAALARNPFFHRRSVRCETEQGRVVLRGVVSSYYHKQMAQEILRRVDGVGQIENQIEVDWR